MLRDAFQIHGCIIIQEWHAVNVHTKETELARQASQRPGRSHALYLPVKHCVHVAPFAPEYPALH